MTFRNVKYVRFFSFSSFLSIFLITALSIAQPEPPTEAFLVDDELLRIAGLNQLPEDLRIRWISLVEQAKEGETAELFEEGKLVVHQLGKLIESFDGIVPTSGKPGYATYIAVRDDLINILDHIHLSLILNLDETDVNAVLNSYRNQREQLESDLDKTRRQLINEGLDLLRQHQDDPFFLKYPHRRAVLADLYFRLAYLSYLQAQEDFLQQQDEYISQLNTLSESDPSAASALRPPTPNYSRVLGMFQRIVDEFPTSRWADDALYNIAIITAEGGSPLDRSTANRLMENFLRQHPESRYRQNVLRRIAEFYFNPPVNNLEKAIELYSQIIEEYKNSDIYSEALYKLGWCYYRQSNIPQAVEYFAQALDATYDALENSEGKTTVLDIASESINYIGICFTVDPREWEGTGLHNMVAWLDNHPDRYNRYGNQVIIQYGNICHSVGRYLDAIETFEIYLERFPLAENAPTIHQRIVETFQTGEVMDPDRALREKIRFFDTYNPDSEWWANNHSEELKNNIVPSLEKYLRLSIDETLFIATDARTGNIEYKNRAFAEVERMSRFYLRFWPKSENAYQINYYLATSLEQGLNRPMDALREYWRLVTAYPDTTYKSVASQRVVAITRNLAEKEQNGEIYVSPTGEILLPEQKPQSFLMPIEGWLPDLFFAQMGETDLNTEEITEQPTEGEDVTEEVPAENASEITEVDSLSTEEVAADTTTETAPKITPQPLLYSEALMFSGYELYLNNFPNSDLSPTILYQAGDLLFNKNMLSESRYFLKKLIIDFPNHRFAEEAYKLLLNGYFLEDDYHSVEQLAVRIDKENRSKDLKQIAYQRKAEANFLNATVLKKESSHLQAAQEYRRVALETPDYELADGALFEAGLEFRLAKAWDEALETFLMVANKYPKSEFADKAIYNAAVIRATELNDPAGSAALYERLVKEYPQTPLAQDALAQASHAYNQVNDWPASIRVNELYVAKFPTAEDANLYLFENAGHYLKLDQIDQANEIYRRFITRFPDDPRVVQAHYERAIYLLSKNNRSEASKEFSSTVAAHQKLIDKDLPGYPKYAAQALATLLEWEHAEYNNLKFKLPANASAQAKQRKKDWRNSLYEKYQQLIALGAKESYQGFYHIGQLDEELADATFDQELEPQRDFGNQIKILSELIDQTILLNEIALQSYLDGMDRIANIIEQLDNEQSRLNNEYNALNEFVAEMQKQPDFPGAADSLAKLNAMRRGLAELDSAQIEANKWRQACRDRVAPLAIRKGDYVKRLLTDNLSFHSTDRDEEIRMLVRQQFLNALVAPLSAEVVSFYLQAIPVLQRIGEFDKWESTLDQKYSALIDTVMTNYYSQINLARTRMDRFTGQYENILPKGEDAQAPGGYYHDEMGELILNQVDYWHRFNLDLINALAITLDTLTQHDHPMSFGAIASDRILQFILDQRDLYDNYNQASRVRQDKYTQLYEETDEIQYDDATVAFEDIAVTLGDNALELLDEGLNLKQQYQLPGEAGIALVRLLVELNPDKYAKMFNIQAEQFSVTSSTNWLIWNEYVQGYESLDFDDLNWKRASPSSFPTDIDMGVLDSLNAVAIWFKMEKPAPTYLTPEPVIPTESETQPLNEESIGEESEEQPIDNDLAAKDSEETPDSLDISEEIIEPLTEEPSEISTESETERILVTTAADSLYDDWMAVDSAGVRSYWFRHAFNIAAAPSAGKIWITADDDYSLFLNGVYIAADLRTEEDWMKVDEYDIGRYLTEGVNLIAISASDIDSTGYGVRVGLIYEIIPDINRQLDIIAERERAAQQKAYDRQVVSTSDTTEVMDPDQKVIGEPVKPVISREELLREMRTIEKNKLR